MTPAASSRPVPPILSVLVCTRDRAAALRATLESLGAQTLPRELFEIVVVDDGSRDATAEVARSCEAALPLRYSRQRPAGKASARNHALFLARGAVLLFLDDGEVAEPELLEAHLDAHRRFPEQSFAVLGQARLAPALAADPLLRFLERARLLPLRPEAEDGAVLDARHFRAERSSCKRRFLLEHGVFDATFRSAWEDVELAWRLSRHAFRVVYAARARSAVARALTVPEACDRMREEGEASVLFARLHGEEAAPVPALAAFAAARRRELELGRAGAIRSADRLDRLARARIGAGLPLGDDLLGLLDRAYLAAFAASLLDGRGGGAGGTFSGAANGA